MGTADRSRHDRAALLVCAALLGLFSVLSYSAVLTKSATYDEPYHAVAAWVKSAAHDYRMDYEDPPLTHYWASLFAGPLQIDWNGETWNRLLDDPLSAWELTRTTLFQTPGNDPLRLINRERSMSLLLGIATGITLLAWTWRLGGRWAAMIACVLFSFDPNFLGHAALIKNDVGAALMLTATMFAIWCAGRRLTLATVMAVAASAAIAMNVKFSSILLWPIIALLLAIRAVMPQSWMVLGRNLSHLHQKLLAGLALFIVAGLVTIAFTWACYGFRFSVSPDPRLRIDPQVYLMELRLRQFQSHHALESYQPSGEQLAQQIEEARTSLAGAALDDSARRRLLDYIDRSGGLTDPGDIPQWRRLMDFVMECAAHPRAPADPFATVAHVLLEHHIMPEAWTSGLMYHYAHSTLRRNFLLDEIHETGWWYYFPLAMLFKTPLATLIAMAIAMGIAIKFRSRWRDFAWPAACVILPPILFMAAVMRSNINLGLRHVLPVYPLLYMAAACLIAPQLTRPRWRRVFIALAILLACETLTAWPDYIAYFNWMCMGPRGGIHLLGDSNLDWGQDLPALAKWQRDHGDPPIALAYFGTADPAAYGVRADPLPLWPPSPDLRATHVLAISATGLQGIYTDGYVDFAQLAPTEVLGGTIYLYDLRPMRR